MERHCWNCVYHDWEEYETPEDWVECLVCNKGHDNGVGDTREIARKCPDFKGYGE